MSAGTVRPDATYLCPWPSLGFARRVVGAAGAGQTRLTSRMYRLQSQCGPGSVWSEPGTS